MLEIEIIFHSITVFFCIFDQINPVLMSIKDSIKNIKNLTDPKFFNSSVYIVIIIIYF